MPLMQDIKHVVHVRTRELDVGLHAYLCNESVFSVMQKDPVFEDPVEVLSALMRVRVAADAHACSLSSPPRQTLLRVFVPLCTFSASVSEKRAVSESCCDAERSRNVRFNYASPVSLVSSLLEPPCFQESVGQKARRS
ncbi:hypothetical protein AOLI_G00128490 [Acnodon oligacanthus]